MKTALGFVDDHRCGELCRESVNGSEVVTIHEFTYESCTPSYVTIQALGQPVERFELEAPGVRQLLTSMGIEA